jgi:hypothetical protein
MGMTVHRWKKDWEKDEELGSSLSLDDGVAAKLAFGFKLVARHI